MLNRRADDLKVTPQRRLGEQLRAPGETDIRDLVRRVWRRKFLIVIIAAIGTVCGAAYVYSLEPYYIASSKVMIESRLAQIGQIEDVLPGLTGDRETVESQIQVIRSRALADQVVDRLRLDRNPEFNPRLRPPKERGALAKAIAWVPDTWNDLMDAARQANRNTAAADANGSGDFDGVADDGHVNGVDIVGPVDRERELIINIFLSHLDVSQEGRSRVINLRVRSIEAETASHVANTLAALYIESQIAQKSLATRNANAWLSDRIEELRAQVADAESAVETFRRTSGLIRGRDVTLSAEQVSEASSQLMSARSARAEAEARLVQIEYVIQSGAGIDTVSDVLNSPLIVSLRQREIQIAQEVAELGEEYGDRHPTMINKRAEAVDVRNAINAEIIKITQALRNEVAVAQARETELNRAVNELKGEVGQQNSKEVQLRALEREAEASRALLEEFLARYKETDSREAVQQPDAAIISKAGVPLSPSFPRTNMLLTAACAASIAVAILIALIAEALDQTIRTEDQVQRRLGAVPLGIVPRLRTGWRSEASPSSFVLEKPGSAFGEAIRSLYTSILMAGDDTPAKVVLIVSALPNEGKTSICAALTRLLASTGKRVLTIDCDLRRPSIHGAFELPKRPGLGDCLRANAALADTVQTDPVTQANVLTGGRPVQRSSEVLASQRMRDLVNSAREQYDLVILDSPPILAVTDSLVLGELADATVLLSRWGQTPIKAAAAALEKITDAGAKVIGVLITMVDVGRYASYDTGTSGMIYREVRRYYTG